MRRDEAIRILRDGRAVWEPCGVSRLRLFGSVARDTARADSDVDLLVEFSHPVGLFELFGLRRELEGILRAPVDLAKPKNLRPELRDKVLAGAIHVA